MPNYYVNNNDQLNGDHEVHVLGCYWLTLVVSKKYLGNFPTCRGAVAAAKKIYSTADGCKHCSPACHTS